MGAYRDELTRAMTFLGGLDNAIFMGQAVDVPGTAMFGTLEGVDRSKRLELPVEEDFQLGMSIGLAMAGHLPISIFPRWNFLLLAMNQMVNHLDKLSEMTRDPRTVIIRTSIGSERPLNPGPQHVGDFTAAVRKLVSHVEIRVLSEAVDVFPAYERAATRDDGVATVIVEYGDFYGEK